MQMHFKTAIVSAGTLGILTIWLCAQAQAVAIRHDTPDARYLELGAQFASVGYLEDVGGSAVLIAPDKLLTAAHVVDSNRDGKPDENVIGALAYFGADLNKDYDAVSSVKSVKVMPQYYDRLIAANDIAIITLSTAITNIEPAKIDLSDLVGRVVTVAGYGIPGNGTDFDEAKLDLDLRRRAAQNKVDAIVPEDFDEPRYRGTIATDFDDPAGNFNALNEFAELRISDPLPLALEGIGSPGDSGGGVFADFGQGYRLVGITSAGIGPEEGDDDLFGRYGSIELNAPLARPGTTAFLSSNGVSLPNRLVAVPEPSTLAIFGVGLLTISTLTRRTRKKSRRDVGMAGAS